jgi:hypothetical protein
MTREPQPERSEPKREQSQSRESKNDVEVGHTPSKAEGDERDIDESLKKNSDQNR